MQLQIWSFNGFQSYAKVGKKTSEALQKLYHFQSNGGKRVLQHIKLLFII